MKILLVNPPDCGRSIPEERYGIDSLRQIFRGEPLALETLAGNLDGHEVRILDLKAEPEGYPDTLHAFAPDLVGFTAVTCEANTAIRLASEARAALPRAVTAVGGIHASNDPAYFNRAEFDYVVAGLGKASFAELVSAIGRGADAGRIPGVAKTNPGGPLRVPPRAFGPADLVEGNPPRYDLVARYRDRYVLPSLGFRIGFVASAFGCPFDCAFCCIGPLTGGGYLTHSVDAVVEHIRLLGDVPVIRLVDANTFGNVAHARSLADAILAAGFRKNFVADVRSDTVVRHPGLLRRWKEAGLRSVIIGFEEIADAELSRMNKASGVSANDEAIAILHELGITVVGDFIVSPDYDEARFEALGRYVSDRPIGLPILTVLTPLPGTALHAAMKPRIVVHDLDYYTLTNAVVPTRLDEKRFYEHYAGLIRTFHAKAKL
ncbi:MAG TPA: radical SAM protein [Candidatus Deferrimicrobiaceae bacterium]